MRPVRRGEDVALEIRRWHEGSWGAKNIDLPPEAPITLSVNGEEFVTMMATPGRSRELIAGFLLTSGLIDSAADIGTIELEPDKGLAAAELPNWRGNVSEVWGKRFITSGCGGGQMFIDPGILEKALGGNDLSVSPAQVMAAAGSLIAGAEMYRKSGGIHAAALFSGDDMIFMAEDIGRHNTFDKVIGYALLNDIPTSDKYVATTGRISAEMAAKAAKVDICLLISRTSPTDMAVSVARAIGMTLVGYARGAAFNIYCHDRRVTEGP